MIDKPADHEYIFASPHPRRLYTFLGEKHLTGNDGKPMKISSRERSNRYVAAWIKVPMI